MPTVNVATHVAVRLNSDDRQMVAEIVEALRTARCPHVSISDALRAGVRELHAAVVRERAAAAV